MTKSKQDEAAARVDAIGGRGDGPMGSEVESGVGGNSESPVPGWNGWPNGEMAGLFTYEQYEATGHFQVHYVIKQNTVRTGSFEAEEEHFGHVLSRACQGVIKCTNDTCTVVIRPKTEASRAKLQVTKQHCTCGNPLVQISCAAYDVITRWKGQCKYEHRGKHHHPLPPIKKPLPWERASFNQIVVDHPGATPAQLRVGILTAKGRGTPVSMISPAYTNADRTAAGRRQALSQYRVPKDKDSQFTRLQELYTRHPTFFAPLYKALPIFIISVQTAWMLQHSVHEHISDSPYNGIVSDGAHGFFRGSKAVLQVSLSYSEVMGRWVPILFTYMEGLSADDFCIHFTNLFNGIAKMVESRGWRNVDDHLTTVSDGS